MCMLVKYLTSAVTQLRVSSCSVPCAQAFQNAQDASMVSRQESEQEERCPYMHEVHCTMYMYMYIDCCVK